MNHVAMLSSKHADQIVGIQILFLKVDLVTRHSLEYKSTSQRRQYFMMTIFWHNEDKVDSTEVKLFTLMLKLSANIF